jgi:hypothetical protein
LKPKWQKDKDAECYYINYVDIKSRSISSDGLCGFTGHQIIGSGYIYAPYIPLTTSVHLILTRYCAEYFMFQHNSITKFTITIDNTYVIVADEQIEQTTSYEYANPSFNPQVVVDWLDANLKLMRV